MWHGIAGTSGGYSFGTGVVNRNEGTRYDNGRPGKRELITGLGIWPSQLTGKVIS